LTNRHAQFFFFMGGLLGSILMFIVCLFAVISVTSGTVLDLGQVTTLTYMTILAVAVLMIGIASYFILSEQEKKHYSSIYTAPSGIIPIEKRPVKIEKRMAQGPEPESSWDGEASKYVKGLYPPRSEFDLKGNWDYPIVSRQQRFEVSQKAQKRMMKDVLLFLPVGTFMLVSSLVVFFFVKSRWTNCSAPVGAIGFALLIVGLIPLAAAIISRRAIEQNKFAASSISVKTMPYLDCFNAVEEILKTLDEPFKKVLKDINDAGNIHHQCTFNYSNGNFVRILFIDVEVMQQRTLSINYNPELYLHALKLQKALDTELSKKDIIYT
jgi:hypothetical protein